MSALTRDPPPLARAVALEFEGPESPGGLVKTGILQGPTPEFQIPEVWVGLEIDIAEELSADALPHRDTP